MILPITLKGNGYYDPHFTDDESELIDLNYLIQDLAFSRDEVGVHSLLKIIYGVPKNMLGDFPGGSVVKNLPPKQETWV